MRIIFSIILETVNLIFLYSLLSLYLQSRQELPATIRARRLTPALRTALFIGITLVMKALWIFALSSAYGVPFLSFFEFSMKRVLYLIISGISIGMLTLFFSTDPGTDGTRLPVLLFTLLQLSVIALAGLSIHAAGSEPGYARVMWLSLFLILLISVLSVVLYRYTTNLFRRELQERQLLTRQEDTEKRLSEITNLYSSLHMLRHDLKRHIQTAMQMPDRDEGKRYLQDVEDQLFELFSTGCISLDALLTVQDLRMKKEGIRFDHDLCSLEGLQIDDVSLCSIVGNLLENAVEAIGRMEAPQNAAVFLQMRLIRGMLFIVCRNPYDKQTVHFENGLFLSDKTAPNHGQGLKIISKLAKEKEGTFTADAEDGIFTATVTLPADLRSDPTSDRRLS